ncbi:proline-rich protein 12 isoform X2 [Cololabis saira]|uniref:proline-rich protein 12 isoform X2 n=1 Tax=Cololabis saira TaxID=129043 RepID=UPI002AD31035|nr:proline-rich protein 12 isoform X2 [Cololabis saira]
MDRNYPAAGFGDLGAGAGWTYDRKAGLMYGSSRSSHPDSELLHRQTYGTPHPLQGYATNHHPVSSRQGGAWGAPGRTLGLSGLFDASLHHASPSGPDPSVMNLISALESRGPQPTHSASSLLSQFRNPSWQTAMHTPAPAELFISGTLPGSGSFPSPSTLSAYQPSASFSGRSFTPSLSLQDAPTFSPSSNGLLSPHDPLLHIKTPSQSSLGFDRLLSSQSAAYRGSQEPPGPPHSQTPSTSPGCHLPPPQFNLLSPQLHNRSSQLYNASMFSSAPALPPPPPPQPPPEMGVSRHDSVIKHYQRSAPTQPTAIQQYGRFGGSSGYQQVVSHHRHVGMSCSPPAELSPSHDPKASSQMESQTYPPAIQTPYKPLSSSASASSSAATKGTNNSGSTSCFSSLGSSSSRAPQTPPSASSTSTSSSSSSNTSTSSLSAPSRQQPPPQSAPAPPPPPVASSSLAQQPTSKQYLSNYGSQSVAKSGTGLLDHTPPHPHAQSFSPNQPPSAHMTQSYGEYNSPLSQESNSGAGGAGAKVFTGIDSGGRSFSGDMVFEDSSFGSASLRRASSPSLGYRSESARSGPTSGVPAQSSGVGSSGSGSGAAGVGNETTSSYHLAESSTSPNVGSTLSYPALHSPAAARPAQSPASSGTSKYLSSILSPAFMPSPQGFPDTRQNQSQSYHSTPTKPKIETNMLAVERSQEEEEDSDFLIHHLLQTQSSTPHSSQHHPHRQQPPQLLSQARDGEGKRMAYDVSKISEERYQPQSVIRTNNNNSSSGPGTAINDTSIGLTRQLDISQSKQQAESDLTISKSTPGGVRGVTDSLSHSHTTHSHQQQHELDSVVHYGRGGPYIQHQHSQLPHHTAHASPHPQQIPQHPRHTQHIPHSQHSHRSSSHMELKKAQNTSDNAYLCNTPDVQQTQQSQVPLSLMDSSPDPSQPAHMLSSVLSHSTHTKMEPQQALTQQQQQHSLSQQAMTSSAAGAGPVGMKSHPQNQSSQLQLQLQNQGVDTHYSLASQSRDQTQASQNAMSPLDMLDQSLSQASSIDSGGPLERAGVGEGGGGDRPIQQQRLTPHHRHQQKPSDLHDFLSEPDLGVSTPSHLHHLSQPPPHDHSHVLQLSHAQLAHPHPLRMAPNMGTPQPTQQTQTREHESQLHSQLDQLKQHQFVSMSPADKVGQHQAQPQQQRFAPLTSICFPDSLLQDEERSFFPEMEDIFCSSEYKSSCAGDSGPGQGPENLSQAHGQAQESIEDLKAAAGEGYDMVAHHGDQGYGQYCHSLPGAGNGNLHLDLDSLKTHELPSTVNTDQLGLIQSQPPPMGLGSAAQLDGSVNKMMGAVGGGANSIGLTSPIFCSSRPKKLLKTSSFHLLKQRREPQPQTKKNYAQEYEFEDDEDKADVPADIRLNSRRLPDLLPDLVSSCRRAVGGSVVSGLSPIIGDMDYCHPSGYSSLGNPPQLLPQEGPKKRGRKPTKPKREGPPRPRGRPRIRPLPEPPYCRGLMGSVGGETKRGRGRGRGRGRREEGLVETHRDMNKAQSLPYHHLQQQQQYGQQQNLQQLPQHYGQQADLHQAPHQKPGQHQLHPQQQVSCSHQQLLHQPHYQQQQQPPQQPQQDPLRPIKMLVDGWKKDSDDPLNPETWAAMQKLSSSVDDKAFDFKPGFMASFLDFLKTGKKPPDLDPDGGQQEVLDHCSSLKGGIRPLSPPPPSLPATPPQQPPGGFGEGGPAEGEELALSGCSSPCKPLDEELKRNLETLPSFSSDEEDSVSKNQDLQKSISSAISALYDTPHSLAAAMASAMLKAQPAVSPPTPQELSLSPPLPAGPPLSPSREETLTDTQQHSQDHEEQQLISPGSTREETEERRSEQGDEEEERREETVTKEEVLEELQDLEKEALGKEEPEDMSEMPTLEVPKVEKVEDPPSDPGLAPAPSSPSPSPSPLPPLCFSEPSTPPIQQDEEPMIPTSYQHAANAGTSPPPSTSPIPSPPLYSLPLSQSIPPPSTTPPPSSSDQDQEPEAGPPSPSSSSSSPSPSSSSSQPLSPPTPEEAPASQRLTSLHLAKKQVDAAIAGESEEEDSESGGEGIFRERDEFVVRTEDIGTLKMALQTGREPPPIWRVQKALLQKFSPEIKDGQRQFCATSNYLGYFGDAKMRYQRLYVKFLENVNKKDYVRVCSRKPWHRAGLSLRRQSLAKQLPANHSQAQARMERQKERELKDQRERERQQREREHREKIEKEQKEKEEREQKEKEKEEREQKEKEKQEREQKEKERQEREQKEKDRQEREQKEKEKQEKEQKEKERQEREEKEKEENEKMVRERECREQKEREIERENENERREKEQTEREMREKEQKDRERREYEREQMEREQKEREKHEREEKEREKRQREQAERERQEREQRQKEKQQRERREKREKEKQEQERREKQREQKNKELKETEKESEQKERRDGGDRRQGAMEAGRPKEEREGEKKVESQSNSRTEKTEKTEPPPKKRRKWLKEVKEEVPSSSSSETDSSLASDQEGPVRGAASSRAMREMFRSYVEMLVSTALDPDMIQALEDTDDELYLPHMRKIDGLLSEQKKRLLRRISMSAQHQEVLHLFPKMTADPLESGAVRVHLGGEGYNRKTLSRVKKSVPKQQDLKLSIETCRIYSLYHSLHHYKYHTFLRCKKETDNIEQAAEDPGQEEVVQQCMANQSWLESLFSSFMELLSLSSKA